MRTASNPIRQVLNRLTILWLVALLVVLAACEQSEVATPRPVVVQIAGATSMHPVLEALAGAFTERHPNVLIEIRGGGSALGEERVRTGRSALGASTLPADQQVSDEPGRTGTGAIGGPNEVGPTAPTASAQTTRNDRTALAWAPIGIDGVAVIVHADNPVNALTSRQLQDVFNGGILDWAELGGTPGDIVLVSREDGSGTRHAFESRVMGDAPVSLTAVVMPTSLDVVDYVAKHRQAIGYVSSAYTGPPSGSADADGPDKPAAQDNPEPEIPDPARDEPIRILAVDGVYPSDGTIGDNSYPLVQPLYLITRGAAQGWDRQFIDFALSPAGQAIIDRYHVPVR